jgi:uncharacterized coiled-coil DUF342 family protein
MEILREQVRKTMSGMKVSLEEKRKMVDGKATTYRTTRDEWNQKTKENTSARNELNSEVRELIVQVKGQREIREQMNELVREKKNARQEANKLVRDAKAIIDQSKSPEPPSNDGGRGKRGRDRPDTVQSLSRELNRLESEFERGQHTGKNETKVMKRMKEISSKLKKMKSAEDSNGGLKSAREELRTAIEQQDMAHEEVQTAAQAAQEAHELMLQWNKEVDKQREKAESCHRDLRRSKKEADKAHHLYIVSLRCLHSIQDILRAMRGSDAGEGQRKSARGQVQDLMSKLMSGETLSTEELMQLQKFD